MDQLRAITASRLDSGTVVLLTTMAIAFVIAENFYKFRSFTLEAIAFLVTWFVLRRVVLFFTDRPR